MSGLNYARNSKQGDRKIDQRVHATATALMIRQMKELGRRPEADPKETRRRPEGDPKGTQGGHEGDHTHDD